MRPHAFAELAIGALLLGAVLVTVYAVAGLVVELSHGGRLLRGDAWLTGIVGPVALLIVPLAVAGYLVERAAGGAATRAVEALRTLAILFILAAAGFAFATVSGMLSPQQSVVSAR